MWPYWIMFLIPAAIALREHSNWTYSQAAAQRGRWNVLAVSAVVVLTVLIGYRDQVGGDWGAYERHYNAMQGLPLLDAITLTDPGYAFFNWVCSAMDWDIYGVNLLCGAVFAVGLLHFCLSQPRPWLALTVAIPYLVIVVGMGYSRQGVALGMTMLGLVALKNKSTFWFIAWGLLGATFHKTAVLLLPIAALARSRNRWWSILLAVVTTVGGYKLLLHDSFDTLYQTYVGGDVQSEGAMVRLLMNAVPSAILLAWNKSFKLSNEERSLWRWFAAISIGMLVGLLLFSTASTALDRMALYMLPLQLMVFSHLPGVLRQRIGLSPTLISLLVILYYATVLFVWIAYANNSMYWLPYRFYPLEAL